MAPKLGVTPEYWDEACKHLSRRDRVMKKLIPQFGEARLQSRGDAFTTLARSVVAQQVSTKAAESIWQRFVERVCDVNPETVLKHEQADLQACGLSSRKALYLHELSRYFIAQPFMLAEWEALNDDEVIQRLTTIKGIGQWTAEMFLIFFMARPNVLPVDDIGLQRAMSMHYNDGQPISKLKMREIARRWAPWHSVATWYMWRSLEPLPVQY